MRTLLSVLILGMLLGCGRIYLPVGMTRPPHYHSGISNEYNQWTVSLFGGGGFYENEKLHGVSLSLSVSKRWNLFRTNLIAEGYGGSYSDSSGNSYGFLGMGAGSIVELVIPAGPLGLYGGLYSALGGERGPYITELGNYDSFFFPSIEVSLTGGVEFSFSSLTVGARFFYGIPLGLGMYIVRRNSYGIHAGWSWTDEGGVMEAGFSKVF